MRKTSLLVIAALIASLSACSVNVKKGENGEEKQVDINTIAGGIHVNKDADVADTGLPVYPGAQLKPKANDQDGNRANVNLSAFGFGLKVVALDYLSDDPPAKIQKFYSDQLNKYGKVLECHTTDFDMDVKMDDKSKGSNELTCEESKGSTVELKVGKKDDQHVVSIKPNGKGSEFSLVYLKTHGKEADI
jgi:hypothetical protein